MWSSNNALEWTWGAHQHRPRVLHSSGARLLIKSLTLQCIVTYQRYIGHEWRSTNLARRKAFGKQWSGHRECLASSWRLTADTCCADEWIAWWSRLLRLLAQSQDKWWGQRDFQVGTWQWLTFYWICIKSCCCCFRLFLFPLFATL